MWLCWCCVCLCLALGRCAAAALGPLWGVGSPAARGAALCRAQKSMGSAWPIGKGEAVSRREMGEGSRGRSYGSVGSCRDRHAPKGTGIGLLEAKSSGCFNFFLARRRVCRERSPGVPNRLLSARTEAPCGSCYRFLPSRLSILALLLALTSPKSASHRPWPFSLPAPSLQKSGDPARRI